MNIIEAWVDEGKVRDMAQQLISSQGSNMPPNEEEFILLSPEELFVQSSKPQQQSASLGDVATALLSSAPENQVGSAQQNAIKALQNASQKAKESGVVVNQPTTLEELDEERGRGSHRGASTELQNHLGASAGALVNREVVTSSLDQIVSDIGAIWGVKEISISDRDGDIFVDTMRNHAWSKLTVSVTEPIRLLDIKQGAIGYGYIHLKVTAKEFLQVVVLSTEQGLLIIGMVREKALRANEIVDFVEQVRVRI